MRRLVLHTLLKSKCRSCVSSLLTGKIAHYELQAKKIRHGIRILRAAGISQTDWHGDQIICLPEVPGKHEVDVVFIDFAFALMYLGDEAGLPVRRDLGDARGMLICTPNLDSAILRQLWGQPLEFEY